MRKTFLNMSLQMVNATTKVAGGNIEHDDLFSTLKVSLDGSLELLVKPIWGTLRERMRKFRTTISITKLMAADALVREYFSRCVWDLAHPT